MVSSLHEKQNFDESVEDYFLLMEDKCTMDHNCLGRVSSVAFDKVEYLTPKGRRLAELLAEAGDGCVVTSGFTEVDMDNLP